MLENQTLGCERQAKAILDRIFQETDTLRCRALFQFFNTPIPLVPEEANLSSVHSRRSPRLHSTIKE